MSPTLPAPADILPLLAPIAQAQRHAAPEELDEPLAFATRLIHVGSDPDPATGAVIPSISMSTTFKQSSPGVYAGYDYSRADNPNRRALETLLASIEAGGAHALTFASGSAATASLLQSLGPGAHVLSVNDVYGGTFRYMTRVAAEVQGLELTFMDLDGATDEAIAAALRPNTRLIWAETPTNPTLRLVDAAQLARVARAHSARPLVLFDNTFLSPFFASPLRMGADVVLHSMTKYINGHSDVVMGALVFRDPSSYAGDAARGAQARALFERARFVQNAFGAVPSPHDAWLAQRGAKTLHLRMAAHGANALRVAQALRASPLVASVAYPGLLPLPGASAADHARYQLAERIVRGSEGAGAWLAEHAWDAQARGGLPFGGMVSFTLAGGAGAARAFLRALRLFALAESLGGVESLAELPAVMTHASIPAAQRAALGISDGLVRLSVGVEDARDLVRDVERALALAGADAAREDDSTPASSVPSGASSVRGASCGSSPGSTSVESLPLKPSV